MKRLFISSLFAVVALIIIKAQGFNPDFPVIEEFEVEVGTINDRVKDYTTDKLSVEEVEQNCKLYLRISPSQASIP